jgi:hypothetical protein
VPPYRMPPTIEGLTEPEEDDSGDFDPLAQLASIGSRLPTPPPRRRSSSTRVTRDIIDQLHMLAQLDPRMRDRVAKAIDALTAERESAGGGRSGGGGRSAYVGDDVKTPI